MSASKLPGSLSIDRLLALTLDIVGNVVVLHGLDSQIEPWTGRFSE